MLWWSYRSVIWQASRQRKFQSVWKRRLDTNFESARPRSEYCPRICFIRMGHDPYLLVIGQIVISQIGPNGHVRIMSNTPQLPQINTMGTEKQRSKWVVIRCGCAVEGMADDYSSPLFEYGVRRQLQLQLQNLLLKKYTDIYSTIMRLKPMRVYLPHYFMDYHYIANILTSVERAG